MRASPMAMTMALVTALMFASAMSDVQAQAETGRAAPRAVQKRAAENERNQLQQKLNALKRAIESTEIEKGRAADELAKSESAISKASRTLRELNGEQASTQARLVTLTARLEEQKTLLATRQQQLANLLRQQHVTNKEEPIPLLLSGEEPARIGRSLRYLDYVAQAQAKLLASIRADLQEIETDQARLQATNDELEDIASESRVEKARLEQQQSQRAQLMSELAKKLASQRAEAGVLQRDESRLGGLVEQLGKLIAQQQKAEALAAEKRRQQAVQKAAQTAAAAARAQQARSEQSQRGKQSQQQQQSQPPTAKAKIELRRPEVASTSVADAIDSDAPTQAVESGPKATPSVNLSSTFPTLKGQLRMPVKGELINRFGTRRNDGPSWKGLFISAPEGTQVHAVAAGQVVFADWLRGFGNLLILDHGGQYLTIYGYNQAVLRHAGDKVSAGEVIANAGNTGGNEQSGLYFEMRYQGRAFDPLGWVTSR